jgi:hypothetical protein
MKSLVGDYREGAPVHVPPIPQSLPVLPGVASGGRLAGEADDAAACEAGPSLVHSVRRPFCGLLLWRYDEYGQDKANFTLFWYSLVFALGFSCLFVFRVGLLGLGRGSAFVSPEI